MKPADNFSSCFYTLSTSTQHKPTLMMIFSFSWVGDGSWSALASTGLVKSWSPNTSLNTLAMYRCCSTLQCSSIDRMTGYLWRKQKKIKTFSFFLIQLTRQGKHHIPSTTRSKKVFEASTKKKGIDAQQIKSEGTSGGHLAQVFGKAQFLS